MLLAFVLISQYFSAQCPTSIVYTSAQSNAQSHINASNYRLGSSVMTISSTSTESFTNTISSSHQTALGINIGHSGDVDNFNDRVETTITYSAPVYNLSFNLNDIDAGDRVRISALNQNGNPIVLTSTNFSSGSNVTPGTSPNWEFFANGSDVSSSDSNTTARVVVNFGAQYVSSVVLQYWDVSSSGSYTIASMTGASLCAQNDTFGNVQLGTPTSASVFANDLSSTGAAASAANTDVTLTNLGGLTGATINPNGTINIPSNATPGSYTLTYRICSPTGQTNFCTTATVSLTVLTCQAGTAAPALVAGGFYDATNSAYRIPCGSTTANLSTITSSNKPAPATVTLTWHSGTPANTANKISPVTALTGTTKYYASFFDSVANCYSPTREIVVTAPICANNDNYTSTPIVAGVGGTLPSIYTNDTYNGVVISTLPVGSVGFQYSLWVPANATVNSNGTITIPATTPAGVYTYQYEIDDLDPDAPTTSNFSTATVTFVVLADSDGDSIPDVNDLDDDNDGILDTAEGYCESQTVYTMNVAATVTGATIGINGGTFNLVYNLTSGTAVPGVGTTFNVPFSYSDFNNTTSSVNHTWEAIINSSGIISILPNTNSLYTTLPTNNTTEEDFAGAPLATLDSRMRFLLSTNRVSQLGTYTTTVGNLPSIGSLASYSTITPLETYSSNNVSSGSTTTSFESGYYAKMQLQNMVNTVNNSRTVPLTVNYGSSYLWDYTAFDGPTAGNANNSGTRGLISIIPNTITFCNHRDTDGDGIPDYLDLDSDNDGCSDAIEGSSTTITTADLVNSSMPGGNTGATSGTFNQPVIQNLGNTVNTTSGSASYGVPTIAGTGQGVGDSANSLINGCICYEDPTLVAGTTYPVKHGITLLGRAGKISAVPANGVSDWPMNKNSAYTALESKTKGFVVTRNSSPETTIAIPVVGMMVFDTDENAGAGCLKIYTGPGAAEGWKCFSTQGCP